MTNNLLSRPGRPLFIFQHSHTCSCRQSNSLPTG